MIYKFKGQMKDGTWKYGDKIEKDGKFYIFSNGLLYKIKPESICQYINKEAKYDMEVYTGDVLRNKEGKTVTVAGCVSGWYLKDFATGKATSLRYIRNYEVVNTIKGE